MSRIYLTALVLIAAMLAASGCGGSSKTTVTTTATAASAPVTTSSATTETTSTPTGKALTRAELIAKADQICAAVNTKRATFAITSVQDYAHLLPLAVDEQTAATELGKLVPPASMARDWKQIVTGFQSLAYHTGKLSEDAQTHNLTGERSEIALGDTAQLHTIAISKRTGFKDCAKTS